MIEQSKKLYAEDIRRKLLLKSDFGRGDCPACELNHSQFAFEKDTVHGNLDHWLSSTSALKVVFGGAESHETNPQETQRRI
jgi:hypothetical protein